MYVKKLKVEYILEKGGSSEGLDELIEELADEFGVIFVGSGYDFEDNIRDMEFEGEANIKE